MRRLASLSLFVALLAPSVTAHAQFCGPTAGGGWRNAASGTPGCVPLMGGLGGTAGFGTNSLPGNDDGSTGVINLTTAFPGGLRFFGGPYMQAYVNNNGNITFNNPVGQFTPTSFPIASQPMIAPYWADVDTRNGPGAGGSGTGGNLVYYDLRAGQMTVTWFNVGYYSQHVDHLMAFQAILRNPGGCGAGDFDVEFRYNRCEWITGDASGGSGGFGGTPAQTGFDAGDRMNYVAIPESLMPTIINVCINSNVGTPGIYQFQVRGGAVVCAGGGQTCDVAGQQGACAVGVNACHGTGVVCQQVTQMRPEICDNIDNDCNGNIDDGTGLCPPSQVCVAGNCITSCLDGGCAMGYDCQTDGRCIEHSCAGMMCPANQRCLHGACVDPCTAITCPHGQECIAGQCIDLCSVLTCDSGYICQNSQCIAMCPCNACPSGQTCNADGSCTPAGCDIVSCPPGMYCDMNAQCADSCAGVTCPANQTCTMGNCVMNATFDGGGPSDGDANIVFADTGIRPGVDTGVRGADGGGDGGRGGPHVTHAGCGCRVDRGGAGLGGLGLGILAWLAARRRRGTR